MNAAGKRARKLKKSETTDGVPGFVLVCFVCTHTHTHTHRWAAGRTGRCRWCSRCGRGTTPTGMRMRTKTTCPSSPWRRSRSSSWTTWTCSPAPAWGTRCPAASTSKSKRTHSHTAARRTARERLKSLGWRGSDGDESPRCHMSVSSTKPKCSRAN